jgi:general secretion pathway protein C
VVALGETAFGARLVRVAGDVATVEIGGRETDLRLGATSTTPLALAPPEPTSVLPAAPAAAGAPQEWTRDDLQRRITLEAPRLLAETTLLPVWNAGRVAGFTITRVPDESLLSDAGVLAGDVLTHVNGTPIDSLATLVGLWPRLQGAGTLEADLLRGGQPVHLQINLK